MKNPVLRGVSGLILALSLSACELRREGGGEPDPAPSETPLAGEEAVETAEPAPSETPENSIFREEVLEEVMEEEPTAPFAITVPFPDGGNAIEGAAEAALLELLQSDALDEGWPLSLRGHTDSSGNDNANLRASRARAEAVAAWLVERGVDDARINVIAFGEQNPIAPNANPDGSPNEEGRASNRRVEIDIAPEPAVTPAPEAESDGEGDDGA